MVQLARFLWKRSESSGTRVRLRLREALASSRLHSRPRWRAHDDQYRQSVLGKDTETFTFLGRCRGEREEEEEEERVRNGGEREGGKKMEEEEEGEERER